MTDLILTEKYSVAADFAKALGVKKKGDGCFKGNDYIITWASGHLVTLYEPDDYNKNLKRWQLETLPIIPDTFKYKPIKKSGKQLKVIKALVKKRDFKNLIIATDAGREGEVIARTILLEAGFTDKSRILRFWTSQALVPDVVRSVMKELKPVTDYDRLWRAGYYRQVADWLVGMNCTRILTIRLKDLFSVGRVQTAVLALLVNRKNQRDNFKPETYFIIKVFFSNEKGEWAGSWFKDKKTRISSREELEKLVNKLNKESMGSVLSVKKEKKKEPPPLLFSLTDLQQEANKRFGLPATKTLSIAQSLYQDKKCLSYPRTDSRVLGTKSLDLVKGIIKKLSPEYYAVFKEVDPQRISLANKRVFNDARLTDHHALIPFKPIPENATAQEKKLFDLIVRRFAAVFHRDCFFENTKVVTSFASETFQTNGRVILEQGWRKVYQINDGSRERVDYIPPLLKGDNANRQKVQPQEKKTTPPPAYTDALLLKDMTNPGGYVSEDAIKKIFRGDVGIGTQSTRAQIIETLILRHYLVRQGKNLIATEKGSFLVKMLKNNPVSGVLISPEETARWEMDLNSIALGKGADIGFLQRIKSFVADSVEELKNADFDLSALKNAGESAGGPGASAGRPGTTHGAFGTVVGVCPACKGDVCENRKAYACTGGRQKLCNFLIWKRIAGKNISSKMAQNLLKYRKSGPFSGFISKKKKRFSASLKIVQEQELWKVVFDFDNSAAPKKRAAATPSKSPVSSQRKSCCPLCGGRIIEGC